uniref:Uncharacterized protein n=1 Tax=Manihot esculenta TaxID=3983 RepID=A0A2C9W5I2_MANES
MKPITRPMAKMANLLKYKEDSILVKLFWYACKEVV